VKVIYSDLISFLEQNPTKEDLSNKLFQLGHEHEIDGEVFNMELTPNRGDCLSVKGLARDLYAFFGKSKPTFFFEGCYDDLKLDFQNLSTLDCPKISFLEIHINKPTNNYKHYLDNYFKVLNLSKTNFFSDISNFISYELGQPTHCYDANSLKSNLVFENKKSNEKFKTLLDSDIRLEGKNSIFSSGNEIISLAGVMGGKKTSCSENTTKVLIECAFFNPESIAGKSIKYGLKSDAAHKFERGVDPSSQEYVLRRFTEIIKDHTEIISAKFCSYDYGQVPITQINFNEKRINKILGTNITKKEYKDYLCALSFDVKEQITVPSFRHDIKNQNDLAEEVARLIGYNNIESESITLPKIEQQSNINIQKLRSFLVKTGFSEVINFPFSEKKNKISLSIDNPLDSNKGNLRLTLEDSLLGNVSYNLRRQKDSIKFFEISDIYSKDTNLLQETYLGIVATGRVGHNHNDFAKKIDIIYLKSLFHGFFNDSEFKVKEITSNSLGLKTKDRIFFIEIKISDIDNSFFDEIEIETKKINFIQYQKISEFPASTRDISFSIKNLSEVQNVIDYFDQVKSSDLNECFMFDFYKNDKSLEVKMGYRFIFKSNTKTLTENHINESLLKLINAVLQIDGVSVPGL
jgi:phenylalanyl-tRNA synthetase beta chain